MFPVIFRFLAHEDLPVASVSFLRNRPNVQKQKQVDTLA